jgi:hypothetical protein
MMEIMKRGGRTAIPLEPREPTVGRSRRSPAESTGLCIEAR